MMYSVAPRNARGSGACVPGCVPGAFPTVPVRKIVPTLRVPCGFTQLLPVSILVRTVSILSFPACAQKYCLHSSPILCALGVAFRIQILWTIPILAHLVSICMVQSCAQIYCLR